MHKGNDLNTLITLKLNFGRNLRVNLNYIKQYTQTTTHSHTHTHTHTTFNNALLHIFHIYRFPVAVRRKLYTSSYHGAVCVQNTQLKLKP